MLVDVPCSYLFNRKQYVSKSGGNSNLFSVSKPLLLNLLMKLHQTAFMTFAYSARLFFLNISQDRPVKMIYICSANTVFNKV